MEVLDRFEHRQTERYNRLRDLEDKEDEKNTFDAVVNMRGHSKNGLTNNNHSNENECDISWSQIRTIEESRMVVNMVIMVMLVVNLVTD